MGAFEVIACRLCGAWASFQPKGLLRPCRGKAEGKQETYLKIMMGGMHPIKEVRMDPPRIPSTRFLWLMGAGEAPDMEII